MSLIQNQIIFPPKFLLLLFPNHRKVTSTLVVAHIKSRRETVWIPLSLSNLLPNPSGNPVDVPSKYTLTTATSLHPLCPHPNLSPAISHVVSLHPLLAPLVHFLYGSQNDSCKPNHWLNHSSAQNPLLASNHT